MMITNFSAGELSNTLFGRIDIPQYYSGASKLENFDVIPAGGIKRRAGMERVLSRLKDENGDLILDGNNPIVPIRVMPFILSRDESYLIIFAKRKMIIYKAGEWERAKKVFTEETLYTETEISEVQCAQNQWTLILAHQKHPPLKLELKDSDFTLAVLEIKTEIKIEKKPEVVFEKETEYDEAFKDGQLTTEKNYPSCVSFFNGRLVFAATLKGKQRLFFSHVNNINDFSTYKKFVTEIKEYVYVRAKITMDSVKVEPKNQEESEKLKYYNSKKYYVDSRFFPEDTVMVVEPQIVPATQEGRPTPPPTLEEFIASLDGDNSSEIVKQAAIMAFSASRERLVEEYNKKLQKWYDEVKKKDVMEFSHPAENISGSSPEHIMNDIDAKIKAFNDKNNNKDTYNKIADYNYINRDPNGMQASISGVPINLKYGASEFTVDSWRHSITKEISKELAVQIGQGVDVLPIIAEQIRLACEEMFSRDTGDAYGFIDFGITQAALQWITKIQQNSYFRYKHEDLEETYYGYLTDIKEQIIKDVITTEVYIPMYTLDQIEDNHPTPDCGFSFEIASGTNDAIQWLAVNRGIIIGTELSEWIIPPDVHATNAYAVMLSKYGSDRIQGDVIGDATCFFQTGLKSLVEYYPNEYDHFRANNMAMLSPQMLSEKKVKEFDFITSPYTKLVITREDKDKDNGDMVTLLYERGTGTFAWSRIVTSGSVKSAAVIPGIDGNDDLYIIVKRGEKYFLEVLKESAEVYLDSYAPWKGAADETGYDKETAVIFDGTDGGRGVVYPLNEENRPAVPNNCFIGYPYTSFVRSMPALANDKMKPNNVANLLIRFHDSFMPRMKEYKSRLSDRVSASTEPFTGVTKSMFPGGWAVDVIFDIYHDKPTRCKILSVYAEVR